MILINEFYKKNCKIGTVSLESPSMEFMFSYDDARHRTSIVYPNGTSATYIYNSVDGRLDRTRQNKRYKEHQPLLN